MGLGGGDGVESFEDGVVNGTTVVKGRRRQSVEHVSVQAGTRVWRCPGLGLADFCHVLACSSGGESVWGARGVGAGSG